MGFPRFDFGGDRGRVNQQRIAYNRRKPKKAQEGASSSSGVESASESSSQDSPKGASNNLRRAAINRNLQKEYRKQQKQWGPLADILGPALSATAFDTVRGRLERAGVNIDEYASPVDAWAPGRKKKKKNKKTSDQGAYFPEMMRAPSASDMVAAPQAPFATRRGVDPYYNYDDYFNPAKGLRRMQ